MTQVETTKESQARDEQRELKVLTLRMPLDVHRRADEAARTLGRSLSQFLNEAVSAAVGLADDDGGPLPAVAVEPVMLVVDLNSFSGRPAINVEALEAFATTIGRVVVKAGYSSSVSDDQRAIRQQLLRRHFRYEELVSPDALRLRIAADCLIAMADLRIKRIVLVTADEELGFLSAVVGQRGGAVYAVGSKSPTATSPGFIRAFSGFRYYDHIDKPPESTELRQLRIKYADALVQTAFRIEQRDAKTVGAAIIPLLRDRNPELSLDFLELRSWRELAEIARDIGLVAAVESSGADFVLRLSEEGRIIGRRSLERAKEAEARRTEKQSVSMVINEIIGTDLPPVSTRFLIFNTVQSVLDEVIGHGGISLVELSYRAAAHLARAGVSQNTIYRLLNGLYRGGAFEFQPNPASEYDPRILRVRIPASQLDDAFVLNLMRLRSRFPSETEPQVFSEVLYGSRDQAEKVRRMHAAAGDSRYARSNLHEALAMIRAEPS